MKSVKNPADLFYVDESKLSVSDEEDCENLMDCEVPPEKVADPVFREKYIKFLAKRQKASDAE